MPQGPRRTSESSYILAPIERYYWYLRYKNSNYSSIAASYVQQWQKFATASDGLHLTLEVGFCSSGVCLTDYHQYGNDSTWGLTYNMFADKLLGTNIIPGVVYGMQTAFYNTTASTFGVQLDTRDTYTSTSW
ncbi:hypothetical protein SCP_0208640 [Sparassis crispa]|uniref:Glutaminase A central domain-containing protein n=1 Tax=Sparassis crispa TaxID=139825 RepID=A0A401GBV9_9APHY|nr:hypothetical protein SCP_0208640 [Sparassis crispa]GBE79664.1 hypothetical protein SCP_0208640 [Sparassis crispa]